VGFDPEQRLHILHRVRLAEHHADYEKQGRGKFKCLVDTHKEVWVHQELIEAVAVFSGVDNPNLGHVPDEYIAHVVNGQGYLGSDAGKKDLEFQSSARFDDESWFFAQSVNLFVEGQGKH